MARDDWRIRVELQEEHAGGFLNRLGGGLGSRARDLAKELEADKLAVSRDDDTLFVYAASREQARQAQEVLEEGYSPWEVRVELASHEEAEKLADELEQERLPVARRWRYLVVGAPSEAEAQAL